MTIKHRRFDKTSKTSKIYVSSPKSVLRELTYKMLVLLVKQQIN
jgi:hypothetical protein